MTTPPAPSPKVLQRYCTNALAILNAQYQASRLITHNTSAGSVREQVLKDFLTAHLPELVTVVSGQIIDHQDNFSKQQDLVLVLKSMPRLPFASGVDLIFQEGVIASIEIKTKLESQHLRAAGENFASVRALRSAVWAVGQMGVIARDCEWPTDRILTAIICYEGMSFESVVATLGDMVEGQRPDLILNLTQGLFVRNHRMLVPQQAEQSQHMYLHSNNPAEGFRMFLTFLTEITGTVSGRAVDWRTYW